MSNCRRAHIPGGTFFFTVKTEYNVPVIAEQQFVALLGEVIREVMQLWPFEIKAIVLLPDHLHAIWSLPPGDVGHPALSSGFRIALASLTQFKRS